MSQRKTITKKDLKEIWEIYLQDVKDLQKEGSTIKVELVNLYTYAEDKQGRISFLTNHFSSFGYEIFEGSCLGSHFKPFLYFVHARENKMFVEISFSFNRD